MADSPETGTETPRLRVHQVAKELGITSRDLLSRLADEGLTVKSPQSVLAADVVARLRGDTSGATGATGATDTQPGPAGTDEDAAAQTPAAAGLVPQVLFVSPSDAPVKATRRRRPARAEATADTTDITDTAATPAKALTAPTAPTARPPPDGEPRPRRARAGPGQGRRPRDEGAGQVRRPDREGERPRGQGDR